MNAFRITSQTVVDDVLRQLPGSSHVFLVYHTDCIGCPMERFCTLADVAHHYQLDLQALTSSLQALSPSIPTTQE